MKRFLFFLIFIFSFQIIEAQPYKIYPFPNAWYNSIDGIRVGIHIKGQMKGTLDDGPHRLNGGLWLGSHLPTHPVSYYLNYVEPIYSWSSFGSEASINWESQFRTGFESYSLGFSKRVQEGFMANEYQEFEISTHVEQFYSSNYTIFKSLVNSHTSIFTQFNYKKAFEFNSKSLSIRLGYANDTFFQINGFNKQEFQPARWLQIVSKSRVVIQSNISPSHLVEHISTTSYRDQLTNPFFRARGTLPTAWVRDFPLYMLNEVGLRGELKSEMNRFDRDFYVFPVLASSSLDFIFDSFISNGFKKIPFIGDVLSLKHYLFTEFGLGLSSSKTRNFYNNKLISSSLGPGLELKLESPNSDPFKKAFSFKIDVPIVRYGNHKATNGVSFSPILSLNGTLSF